MKIVIPKETTPFEKRIAATPETVAKFLKAGFQVTVEKGAGEASHIADDDFVKAGAAIEANHEALFQSADIVLKVQKPLQDESSLLKKDSVLIAFLQPLNSQALMQELATKGITAFSMEMIPRIARAQKLDALSSQSNVAGYKAMLMAANAYGKMMPMMMTAAGTVTPAKVLVIGAGVAGLQAIATAKRLGANVEAFDTRPAVKEQVESLGAKFLELDIKESTETQGGYAKALSQEAHQKEQALLAKHAAMSDVVITTALIPGKPAPRIITADTVKKMRHGSVVVDLAAETGGNCELTEPGKEVVKHGVTLIGTLNIPSTMAAQSSQLYARNIMNLLFEIFKDGKLNIDLKNEVISGSLVTHGGEVVHPVLKKG